MKKLFAFLMALILLLLTSCTTELIDNSAVGENISEISNEVSVDASVEQKLQDFEKSFVSRVVDGDTIELSTGEKVRFILVDTPECKHPDESRNTEFGKEAYAFTEDMLQGQTIYMEKDVSDTDKYGRLLRYIYLPDGTFFNELLVKEGYARIATYPPDVKYESVIREAEKFARKNNLGLWAIK